MSSLPAYNASHATWRSAEPSARDFPSGTRASRRVNFPDDFPERRELSRRTRLPARSRSRVARLIEGSGNWTNFRLRRLLEYSRSIKRRRCAPRFNIRYGALVRDAPSLFVDSLFSLLRIVPTRSDSQRDRYSLCISTFRQSASRSD